MRRGLPGGIRVSGGAAARPARHLAVPRAGFRRRRRLRRSGNFATNMAGGAKFGYLLLWVIVAANGMAMLIQSLSAKLGIATGQNLPEVCRERFPRRRDDRSLDPGRGDRDGHRPGRVPRRRIGINLLFRIPLPGAGYPHPVIALAILPLQSQGFRRLEAVIAGLVGLIVPPPFPDPGLSGATPCRRRLRRASEPPRSRARRASCSPSASSGPRSCRTSSISTRR